MKSPPADPKDGIQREATDAIIDAFFADGERRATAVLPGCAGKTVLGLRVAEEALARARRLESALVLLPGLDLVSQTLREWRRWGDEAIGAGCGRLQLREPAKNVKCHGTRHDPAEIAAFLNGGGALPRVLFCTYHSAAKVAEALNSSDCRASLDLLISDEAQRTSLTGGNGTTS